MLQYYAPAVLGTAYVLDLLLGDPRYRLHPVRVIGRVVQLIELRLFKMGMNNRAGGFLAALVSIAVPVAAYILVRGVLFRAHILAPLVLDIYLVYSAVALRDLFRHAQLVRDSLDQGRITEARRDVNKMVGRNCSNLDLPGVSRATVESVAENFVDSFFAPVFWFVAGASLSRLIPADPAGAAVACLLVYRVINTLDAMIGYKNDRYRRFGAFAARLDDVLNFLPSRASIIVLAPAAVIHGLDVKQGVSVFLRDRLKHESPNAAHAESFVAGALGLRLGGPAAYSRGFVHKPWLGNGGNEAGTAHISATCRLTGTAGWITIAAALIITFL